MTFPPRPYDFLNRRRSVLWSTLSNAADRSSSVSNPVLPVSSADSKGETRSVQGLSLVALQNELPMVPNSMLSCELVAFCRYVRHATELVCIV